MRLREIASRIAVDAILVLLIVGVIVASNNPAITFREWLIRVFTFQWLRF